MGGVARSADFSKTDRPNRLLQKCDRWPSALHLDFMLAAIGPMAI